MRTRIAGLVGAALLLAACSGGGAPPTADPNAADPSVSVVDGRAVRTGFPPPPEGVPTGPLDADTADLVATVATNATTFGLDRPRVVDLGQTGDARLAWFLTDLMRVFQEPDDVGFLVDAFTALTGTRPAGTPVFRDASDLLIAWDLPAPPGYPASKGILFEALESRWAPFFADPDATVDWRLVTWGGVFIDDRDRAAARAGDACRRGCIPALVDPPSTGADDGFWLAPDASVFGVEVGGDARAYPVNVLEIHEVVQDTLGGRRIALVFCTLCRSAQAFLVDDVPDALVADVPGLAEGYDLRTSGLLQRSNKLSYERETQSLIESFTGEALSGPLREAGVTLDQVSVVTSAWGAWRSAHPDTTVLARDGGIGRIYDADPLGDRDDAGPIFAIGDVDPRLDPQDLVVGAIAPGGIPVAFPVVALTTQTGARRAVRTTVGSSTLEIVVDGGGFRVRTIDGRDLVSHEAFWFAWSQFHPDTVLWTP